MNLLRWIFGNVILLFLLFFAFQNISATSEYAFSVLLTTMQSEFFESTQIAQEGVLFETLSRPTGLYAFLLLIGTSLYALLTFYLFLLAYWQFSFSLFVKKYVPRYKTFLIWTLIYGAIRFVHFFLNLQSTYATTVGYEGLNLLFYSYVTNILFVFGLISSLKKWKFTYLIYAFAIVTVLQPVPILMTITIFLLIAIGLLFWRSFELAKHFFIAFVFVVVTRLLMLLTLYGFLLQLLVLITVLIFAYYTIKMARGELHV